MNGQPIEIISDVRPIDINRMVCLGFYIYDLQSLKTFKDMGAMLRVNTREMHHQEVLNLK